MPFKEQSARATITIVEDLLKKKKYAAANKELARLIEVGAHLHGGIGQHILLLYEQLKTGEYYDSLSPDI